MLKPLVSVIIPVYNVEKYLSLSISSMCEQTLEEIEIICVDDGSSDSSLDILKEYEKADKRVKVLEMDHGGIVDALNAGIEASSGKYIARMDGDDIAVKNRLQLQLEYMEKHEEVVALGTAVTFIDPNGRLLMNSKPACDHEGIEKLLIMGKGSAIIHPSSFFRMGVVREIGCYRRRFQHIEDLDLYLRLGKVGKLHNLDNPLLKYRLHLGSANVVRRVEQKKLTVQLLSEIKVEEGDTSPVQLTWTRPDTELDIMADWGCRAFMGGHFSTGLLYCIKVFFARPVNFRGLKLALKTFFFGLRRIGRQTNCL